MANQFTITDRYITHNGTKSQFIFVGLERNIESIRSLEGADIVWIEEAKTISAKSMEILLPTVRAAGSELIWTWNPEKPTDPVDRYFREGSTAAAHASSPRSPTATIRSSNTTEMPNEMAGAQARQPRPLHARLGRRVRCLLSRPRSSPTSASAAPTFLPICLLTTAWISVSATILLSWSRSSSSPTQKQIYIANEASGRVTMDQLPHLVRSVTRVDGDLVKCDSSSQPGTIEFLQSRGINALPAKKGPGSVKSGILWLQGYEIVIDPNCEKMQEEAHLYSWMTDKLTGQALSTPVDAYQSRLGCRPVTPPKTSPRRLRSMTTIDGGVLQLKLW